MNPPFSVIALTLLAGAAQGLVVALALLVLAGRPVAMLLPALAVALALLGGGLLASFAHLGRPERAWRAAAMWRTSWLSREVIVLPALVAAVALWGWLGARAGAWLPALVIVLALALWWCTAMIYACLAFVPQWANGLTLPNFIATGLASGLLLACALAAGLGDARTLLALGPWALAVLAAAAALRAVALQRNAAMGSRSSDHTATGIALGPLRQLSMGFTGGSFNTREFFHGRSPGFVRGMKLALVLLGFALPSLLVAWGLAAAAGWPFVAAAALQVPGLVAERWLFFAEARHPQNLYYQRAS